MLLMALIKIFGDYLMKKLVSVLGSIVMGVNIGAVSSNAMCVSVRSQAKNEAKIFDEIMGKYAFDSDCIETEGWTLIETNKILRQLAKKIIKEILSLERTVGVFDFKPKDKKYSEISETLHNALQRGLKRACYVVPRTLKKEGWGPFAKEHYQLFKNEDNVELVEENLPRFLKKLSAYLDLKDSKERSALKLKKEMQDLLNGLPDPLSELIVAALNIYNIKL